MAIRIMSKTSSGNPIQGPKRMFGMKHTPAVLKGTDYRVIDTAGYKATTGSNRYRSGIEKFSIIH